MTRTQLRTQIGLSITDYLNGCLTFEQTIDEIIRIKSPATKDSIIEGLINDYVRLGFKRVDAVNSVLKAVYHQEFNPESNRLRIVS